MPKNNIVKEATIWPGVACGAVLAGYGIWKMVLAKKHIDEVCKKINMAKVKLINETWGSHNHRPGDDLIRIAFEGLTEMYFGKGNI